jgi:hypothetical protein
MMPQILGEKNTGEGVLNRGEQTPPPTQKKVNKLVQS